VAKVHHVKKARKAIPSIGVEVGDSYYWWQLYRRPKQYSKTPPKPSQVTGSAFMSTLYSIDESLNGCTDKESVASELETAISSLEELRDDTQEKLDNMPQGLQDGDTGQQMQERIDALESYISSLEDIKTEAEDEDTEEEAVLESLQGAIGEHGL